MRRTKRTETGLISRAYVGIVGIERRALVDQHETGVEVCLKQDIDVHVGAKAASIAHMLGIGIGLAGAEWPLPILNGEP